MGIKILREAEVFPAPGPQPLSVRNVDGEFASQFVEDHAEVDIFGVPTAEGRLVVSVRFDTFDQAQRAGKILSEAFTAVTAIQAEPKPTACVLHRFRVWRFSRTIDNGTAVCTRCGAVADLVARVVSPDAS